MLPSPDQSFKIGWVGRSVFFYIFFFFLRTVRELSFPIFFFKFLNGENLGGMQSKRIYKSCKCFFKPLNTNFSKFFAQIWHKKKKKKRPCFFAFYGRSGEGNITIFFFGLTMMHICTKFERNPSRNVACRAHTFPPKYDLWPYKRRNTGGSITKTYRCVDLTMMHICTQFERNPSRNVACRAHTIQTKI